MQNGNTWRNLGENGAKGEGEKNGKGKRGKKCKPTSLNLGYLEGGFEIENPVDPAPLEEVDTKEMEEARIWQNAKFYGV